MEVCTIYNQDLPTDMTASPVMTPQNTYIKCSSSDDTGETATTTIAEEEDVTYICRDWCFRHRSEWAQKCNFSNCNGCFPCNPPRCKRWCSRNQESWSNKCDWINCAACDECM